MQASGGEGGDRSQALRLKGAAVETIKVEAEIDATDRLEHPDQNPTTVAARASTRSSPRSSCSCSPRADGLQANDALSRSGVLEVLPIEAPLTAVRVGRNRVVPVRITDLSITEEAFDANLNPIRAKVVARAAGALRGRPRLRPPRRRAVHGATCARARRWRPQAGSVALSALGLEAI